MGTIYRFDPSKSNPKIVDSSGGHNGEPPYNDDMETRVQKLEKITEAMSEKLNSISSEVVIIKNTMATKAEVSDFRADLHKEMTEQTWKIVGAIFAAGSVLTYAVYHISTLPK